MKISSQKNVDKLSPLAMISCEILSEGASQDWLGQHEIDANKL
jgi:hypothetical protein